MTQVPKDKILQVARRNRPALDTYLNCGPINGEIADALRSTLEINATVMEGEVVDSPRQTMGAEHAFICISPDEIEEINTRHALPVILDGALDQFSEEMNKYGRSHVCLGSHDELTGIHLIRPSDKLYNHYKHYEF